MSEIISLLAKNGGFLNSYIKNYWELCCPLSKMRYHQTDNLHFFIIERSLV